MKRIILFLLAGLIFGKLNAQSIPDNGFENWNSTTWGDPQYYTTSNSQLVTQVSGGTANVTKVAGWTNGVNGVQLTTELNGSDTSIGFITNSIDNPAKGMGGIPYNQKPTGIEIWYTCNMAAGDSGLFGVFFKQGGVLKQFFLYTVTGTHSSYLALPETFSPVLNFTPDTVIFAAVSSVQAFRNKSGIPGSTFTISGVTFTGSGITNPAEMNGDFVNWVNDTVYTLPGWTTGFPGTIRSTDTYSGNYSLELQTLANGGGNNNVQAGFATTGKTTNSGFVGGYPYTKTVDTLDFYYKYTPAVGSNDSAGVNIEFKKSGSSIWFTGGVVGAESVWTLGQLFDSIPGSTPDSVIVSFFSSKNSNPPSNCIGSTLLVDDVHFASQPTGIAPILLSDNSLLIYPNPANNQITVSSTNAVINEVCLDNILGQTLVDKQFSQGTAANKETIDVSRVPSGIYFITVDSGNKISIGKVLVNK